MFKVDEENCVGCAVCINVCPQGAISLNNGKAVIDPKKCVNCGRCASVCPRGAIHPQKTDVKSDIIYSQRRLFLPWKFGMGKGRKLRRGRRRGRGM